MTKQYQGKSGKIYEVFEKKIAGGGEGNIHEIQGDEGLVAKIFKAGRTSPEREEKLLLMMKKKLSAAELQQVAWPQDVIYEQSGFTGYIMPKIRDASSLTELYSDKKYNLNHRLIVAYNLAGAVDTVHQMRQVVGDFNPQNICVRLKGNDKFKVTLVDTDSYHITADGKTYRCEVGRGEYIAPELQKKLGGNVTLKSVPLPSYTKETDLFALAVHIFQLLMNGCHPFACAKETNLQQENISRMTGSKYADSVVAPQPIENIKAGFCAFYEKKLGFAAPPYAPVFESLPIQIREMFIQTFKEGYKNPAQRITALEWQKALRKYTEHIRECSENHFYFDHSAKCPLCEAEKRWKDVLKIVSDPQPESIPEPIPEPQPSVSSGTGAASSSSTGQKPPVQPEPEPKPNKKVLLPFIAVVAAACLLIWLPDIIVSRIADKNAIVSVSDDEKNNSADGTENAGTVGSEEKSSLVENNTGKNDTEGDLDNETESQYASSMDDWEDDEEEGEQGGALGHSEVVDMFEEMITAIEDEEYEELVQLADEFVESHNDDSDMENRYYIQDDIWTENIESGKGFIFQFDWTDEEWKFAYYGEFDDGMPSGSGVYIDKECSVTGEFEEGYMDGYCVVEYFSGTSSFYAGDTFKGTYSNGWENGSFTWVDKDNKHDDTYTYDSEMGMRKLIEMDDEKYVWAKAEDGWVYYTEDKDALKVGRHICLCEDM